METQTQVWQAAAVAAVATDLCVHPIETLITRIQSPAYSTTYKYANGSLRPAFFRGVYQGFGPTLIAGVPSSIAFFTVYEGVKSSLQNGNAPSVLQGLPLPVVYGLASAAADLVACAIANPAEVLKQNAQVATKGDLTGNQRSHIARVLKDFAAHPTRLWTGYTALATSHLPGTCLFFTLYEYLKEKMLPSETPTKRSILQEVQSSVLSAGLAGGFVSGFFVPIDVIKTRMRLAAGSQVRQSRHAGEVALGRIPPGVANATAVGTGGSPIAIAKDILRKEGVLGLFRGSRLTFVASAIGGGLYLGCYEGGKMYFGSTSHDDDDRLD